MRNKDEILLPLVAGRWGEDQVGSYSQALFTLSIQQEPHRFEIQKSSTNSDVLSLQDSDLCAKHHQNVSSC